MTTKAEVIERLGEKAVLLPLLIPEALAANDRIKLRLSLIQEAAAQAQTPNREPNLFRAERDAAGLDAQRFDSLIAGARSLSPTRLWIPGASELIAGMSADLSSMVAPLQAAEKAASRSLIARADAVAKTLPVAEGDQLDLHEIADLTSASRADRDTLHLLVMDLHKAINRLAADIALETVDGARVHGIDGRDRVS